MRIGIVCPYSFDVPGGVQFHVRDLAEYLIDAGHEVSVLAPADSDTELPDYVVSAGRATAVRYNGSVARLNFGPVTASKVGRWLEHGDFDVLHLHEPVTPSVSVLALMAADGPIVATFHTSMIRSRTMQAAYPIFRSSLEKIAGRIAVSEDARRTVTTHIGGDAVVIPNGVNVDRFSSAPHRPDWTGTPERPTIAFLGRMEEPRKGLPVLAAALPAVLAEVPGLRVLVAGPGDPKEVTSGLPEHVAAAFEFLGAVSDEEKASLLASVDVYVAPNTGGESFGIILIEAMSAGACVLASDISAFSRVLDGGATGELFHNEDPDDLAKHLLALLRDGERRADLAAAGRTRARLFDWSVVADRIIAVYETVIEGRMAARPEHHTGWNRFLRGGIGR
ncbi:GDP-mannose-dependent alpha-(1-2)-phosphatidylinositol mannosyltransferase [Intrasporangium oryzae NRRL B-24470]|uniref:D-inositol 3-phosphate glycosyltransferase n=1 Tax=Intrasporangium oryzae NRRL B-24470 TaxID=1386089 RepID=W9G9Z1_9MICO|nr:glycosyltransferase family 4 protein [Intrasporangium oryzae]EWT01648.1 GDP-mannose-dependent alpha-(1-2)-phosphatidylinositol mannosyltransferase [Intrasporangium oryzae NRRL B-24470]